MEGKAWEKRNEQMEEIKKKIEGEGFVVNFSS